MDFESKITPDRVESDFVILRMIRGELSLTTSFWVFSLLSNFIYVFLLVVVQDYVRVTGNISLLVFTIYGGLFWRHLTFLGTWRSCKKYNNNNAIKQIVRGLLVFGWIHLVFQVISTIPALKYL